MTMVLAEDDPDVQELLKLILQQLDPSVTAVDTGAQALEACHRIEPDLVLLDVSMPEMNGLEVCRALRCDARLRDVPVVMVTAKTQPEDIAAGYAAGADSYIAKPFSPGELLERVAELLPRRHAGPPAQRTSPESAASLA